MPNTQNTALPTTIDDAELLTKYLELAQPKPGQHLLTFTPPNHPTLDFLANHDLQPVRGLIEETMQPQDANSADHILMIKPALFTSDVQGFMNEIAQVIKPGGTVAVIAYAMPKNRKASRYVNALLRLYAPQHNWAYSLPRWSGIFKQAGLTKKHTVEHTATYRLADWLAAGTVQPDTALKLAIMLRQSPEKAQAWLNTTVNAAVTSAAADITFTLHSGLVLGCK